ncbi:serine protease [Candidatus Synechococcus calcipolaris G9]|uniref:Serine protease n=1 Tax=Candidatus Synechococcus calcipolaris G9 TaxID=1497997 RepID=A0ABT6EXK0_9SYNE|nr:serine protease [Candidatus Synechococcus calcipolaris]MDG2990537.1 serine protease [Candidatus Synechococcus calcipolaris G9]
MTRWLSGVLGLTMATAAIVAPSPVSAAMSGEQINEVARNITVLISGKDSHGSGSIISRSGSTYYVLTAKHVVSVKDDYRIVTIDQKAHPIDFSKIKFLPDKDLAIIEFTSDENYKVATLANSDLASEGAQVFISGWPQPGGTGQLIRQFTDGRISGFLIEPIEGYKMVYTNVTRRGMSGGPVLDAGGRVVGVHGLGDTEDPLSLERQGLSPEAATSIASLIKPGFNYAIPINTFLTSAPMAGIFLSLDVDNSPVKATETPVVVTQQTDSRDRIDNLDNVLRNIDTGTRIIRRFLPF